MADNLEDRSKELGAGENKAGASSSELGVRGKKINHWLWWVLGIIILAAIGVGVYYYWTKNKTTTTPITSSTTTTLPTSTPTTPATTTPAVTTPTTTDATADWKTYTNTSVGFSFKYPTDWKLEDDGKGEINLTDSKKAYVLENSSVVPIVIGYTRDSSGANINTYLTGGRAPLKSILKTETVKIGGKTAYVLQGTTDTGYADGRTIFYNGYVVSFDSNGTFLQAQDTNGSINATFSKVLSTVSFTN